MDVFDTSIIYMSIFFRPGFTRLSLAYFMEEDMVDFIIQAVAKVATDGWKLLPLVSQYHNCGIVHEGKIHLND